ncbi:MAG: hypothetical protein PUE95_01850 [Lachnospiraceae bacterium]|nr:hypothetical protein [Lachnospiraceae bacterium]
MKKQKEVRIKYDKQSMKILMGTFIVAMLLLVIGIVLLSMKVSGTEIFILLTLYLGAGLAVFSLAGLLAGFLYMKRLKKYGYEIPIKKSDYDEKIENLPKTSMVEGTSLFSVHSQWSCRACVLLFFFFLILDVLYYVKWKFMGDESLFVLCFFFYLIWLIFALALKKQSNGKKYRDDVEPDASRKERWSLEQVVFTMFVLFLLSLFANHTAHSMTEYIFKSWIEHDVVQINIVGQGVMGAISEYQDENETMLCKDTYEKLCEGVDITTWGVPKDELQTMLADSMGIDDFSLMRDDFRLSDGDARIFVQISGENVTVRLLNPIKELEKYGTVNQIDVSLP